MARRKAVLHEVEHDHGVPFQPLGGVDGGEHDPARFVEFVGLVLRRFQREVGHELFQIGVGRGDVREFGKPLLAAAVVGEHGLQPGRVVLDDHFDECGGRQVVLAQLVEQEHVRPQVGILGAGFPQGVEIALRGDLVDLLGRLGAHALGEPGDALEGGHVQRVDRQPDEGDHVLDVHGFGGRRTCGT